MAAGIDTDHFRLRVLQDAFQDALASTYRRRAKQLEDARPRAGDYRGKATRDEIAQRWLRLTQAAKLCRHRAEIAQIQDLGPELVEIAEEGSEA